MSSAHNTFYAAKCTENSIENGEGYINGKGDEPLRWSWRTDRRCCTSRCPAKKRGRRCRSSHRRHQRVRWEAEQTKTVCQSTCITRNSNPKTSALQCLCPALFCSMLRLGFAASCIFRLRTRTVLNTCLTLIFFRSNGIYTLLNSTTLTSDDLAQGSLAPSHPPYKSFLLTLGTLFKIKQAARA